MSSRSPGERSPSLITDEEGAGPPLLFLHALGALPFLLEFGCSPKPDIDYIVDDHLAATMPNLMLVTLGDGHHLFLRGNAARQAAMQDYLGNISYE